MTSRISRSASRPPRSKGSLKSTETIKNSATSEPSTRTRNDHAPDLKDHHFQCEYRSGHHDLIREFYHPALARSNRYWRAVGYFSSSAFEAIGEPLGEFFASGGELRLVTSVELQAEDVEAIRNGMSRQKICESRLLEQIRHQFIAPMGRGSQILVALIEAGRMEIRIALPERGSGIYHEKVGIFLAPDDIFLAFSGSSNESRSALEDNYECVDVYPSWLEPNRANAKRAHFERLWAGREQGVVSLQFPEAARREILRIYRTSTNRKQVSISSSKEVNPWRHQDKAIEAFMASRRGVLEMATGTGKTRTAIEIFKRLAENGTIGSVIVAADGTDLLEQWSRLLLGTSATLNPSFRVHRHYGEYHERDEYALNPEHAVLVVSRPTLYLVLKALAPADLKRVLLVHDEVHRLGSPANQANLQGLSDPIVYRLGLSATPEREYDAIGTAFIQSHVGAVIFRFDLQRAIRAGILCEFDYHVIEYELTPEDREAKRAVYKQAAARAKQGSPMSPEEIFTALAKVDKLSAAKLPLFEHLLEAQPDILKRCIIFVEEKEYGEEVCRIIHAHRHDYHTYYAEDDRYNLQSFARGDISCLVTCHRLSEGIDVPSVRTVVIFSSNRARLETIQRMGRCLRIDPTNPAKRALVVDFVKRLDPETRKTDAKITGLNADRERMHWLTQLAKTTHQKQ